jgi:hypothetical protein
MAFCTSCGASLDPSMRFCTACGTPIAAPASPAAAGQPAPGSTMAPASPPSPYASTTATTTTGGSGVAKVIIIVVVILLGLALLAGVAGILGIRYIAHRVKVDTSGDRARVSTPFGTVVAGDAAETARSLGVDVYPGARPLPGGATVNLGNFHTAAAEFQTPDSPEQVASWYRSHYPRSQINVADQNESTMVFSTSKGMVTIAIQARGNMTHIAMSSVAGANTSGQEPK